jgi:hypothetical protein
LLFINDALIKTPRRRQKEKFVSEKRNGAGTVEGQNEQTGG